MIGNDVVDLILAQKESNWQRKGYLDKIFTKKEQIIIQKSENQEIVIWDFWSRKEAAYKIWNRKSNIRKYNPIRFECSNLNLEIGRVRFESLIYYTKTQITKDFIHTIAVSNKEDFSKIKTFKNSFTIKKLNGFPFYSNINQQNQYISKSQHGRFEFIIGL